MYLIQLNNLLKYIKLLVIWLVTLYAYSNYNNIDSLHSNVLGIKKQELENDIHIVVKPVWISDVVV
mgnify:CR=1 FL=1